MVTEKVAAVVVGAGVIGLACARSLARRGLDTVILETEDAIGTQTSSRNSEVIHAGIYYYPAGSLKARLCVAGRHTLYAYCASHGVPHRHCGKLIVATAAQQEAALADLHSRATANGVDDLRWLTGSQAHALEPELRCTAALLSPSTGIIDSHALMLALLGDAESHGAVLALRSPLLGACRNGAQWLLEVGGSEPSQLRTDILVNAAGLQAPALAQRLEGMDAHHLPHAYFAKGSYYALAAPAPFSRLIYPVPEPGGLGVHLTLDLAGQARFGPDVEWVDSIDYRVDPRRAERFYGEVRKYWPALPDGTLQPAYAGVRPKIAGPGEAAADFVIQGPQTHAAPGLVNLFGIESPGLTACLAIAERACAAVGL